VRPAASDLRRPVEPGSGNVLVSGQQRNRLRGDQGSATLGVARNIGSAIARRVR
jgi:hypothetical protein